MLTPHYHCEQGHSFQKVKEYSFSCKLQSKPQIFKYEILEMLPYLLSLEPHLLSAVKEKETNKLVSQLFHT